MSLIRNCVNLMLGGVVTLWFILHSKDDADRVLDEAEATIIQLRMLFGSQQAFRRAMHNQHAKEHQN